jgi:glycosyltransferase involved in cell wall biosynthesis
MQIAFDGKRAFHNFTGLGNYSRTLLEDLGRFHPGHRYVLYTPPLHDPRGLEWADRNPGIEIRTPSSPFGRALPGVWRSFLLASELRRDPPDLYHGLSHELPAGIERTGIPAVVTVHDLIFLRHPRLYPWIDREVYRRKVRHACRVAARVVAVGEQTRRDLEERLRVPGGKIALVHQACDRAFLEEWDEDRLRAVRDLYGLPDRYVLYVGTLNERKNALVLLRAFARLDREDTWLVLVGGGGAYRRRVIEETAALRVRNRVKRVERVAGEDLPGIYRCARAFVYPSLCEGFGLPVVEALTSGVPVIASAGAGLEDAGGEGALYVDPRDVDGLRDALERVLDDEALRVEMIRAGREHARRFRGEETSARMMALYREVAGD